MTLHVDRNFKQYPSGIGSADQNVENSTAVAPTNTVRPFLENRCYIRTRFVDTEGVMYRQFAMENGDWTRNIREAALHANREVCANRKQSGTIIAVAIRVHEGTLPVDDKRPMVFPVAIAYAKNTHNQVEDRTVGRLVTRRWEGYSFGEAIKDVPTAFAQDAFFYASSKDLAARVAKGDAGMNIPINDPQRRIRGYEIRSAYGEFVLNPK